VIQKIKGSMIKLKAAPFIVVGILVHLGLCVAVFSLRVNCNFRDQCMSTFARISEQILAMPLSLFFMLLRLGGGAPTGFNLLYPIINSIMAVTILWFVLVRPLMQRAARRSKGAA
jgi:hypothetical protein